MTTELPFSSVIEFPENTLSAIKINEGLNAGYIFLITIGICFVLLFIKVKILGSDKCDNDEKNKSSDKIKNHSILKFRDNKTVKTTLNNGYNTKSWQCEYSPTEETSDESEESIGSESKYQFYFIQKQSEQPMMQ